MHDRSIKHCVIRTAAFLLLCFGALILYIVYLQTIAAEGLAHHSLNRRSFQNETGIRRGEILDTAGRVLAQSSPDGMRNYPFGEAMAPVTGYLGETIGSDGMEAYANRELLGLTDDLVRLGPIAQIFQSGRGNDVRLTVDADVQQNGYDALDGRRGAVVVLDADTGAVLAMVSSPSFEPAQVEADWDTLRERQDSPLLNRALQGLYPPGSTIKPLIADAAMELKVTDSHEIFHCEGILDVGGGYSIQESHGAVHGKVKLQEALVESCNITFGSLGMRLEGKGLAKAFERFGFQKALDGELRETMPQLPDFIELSQGELAQIGIGQSSLLVTPMHMALTAAAMANGGRVMKPYIIDQIVTPKGVVLKKGTPEIWFEATSRERAELIDGWMEDVVQEGTGTRAKISGIRVTGKTGTAENSSGEDHAWFIGSADLGVRRIVFSVIIENGGSGGSEAAPIARKIILSLDK